MCTGTHPFIPAEDTARVEMIYTVSGQRCMNVFYFQKTGGWTAETLEDLCESVHTGWVGDMQSDQSTGVTLEMIRALDVAVEDGNVFEYTGFTPFTGSHAVAVLPGNVTLAIKFGSTRSGRSYRGRMYFIGLAEDYVSGNSLNTTDRDAIVANVSDLFAQVATDIPDAKHVIVSTCQNGDWLTSAVITPVATYSADVNVDSQRNRLSGRGT